MYKHFNDLSPSLEIQQINSSFHIQVFIYKEFHKPYHFNPDISKSPLMITRENNKYILAMTK